MALIAAMSALAAAIPAHAQFFKDTSASALGCPDSGGGILPHCQNGASVASIQAASSFSQTSFKGAVAPVIVRKDKADATPANDPPPESLASEPQSEFQQFVAASVGKALPVFGAELFHRAPATFAPVDRIPVTGDYVVGPGDELIIRMWGPVNLNLELTVDRNGAVFVPQAGSIMVAGIAYHQLQGFLRSQLERVYRNFDLNVNLGQLRSIQVFAAGQARRPGSYTVSSLSSLLNALFVSGGPSSLGSMRRVQLKRNGVAVTEFDIYDLLLEGDKSKDARLLPGDVVHIPVSGPQAAIAGSVRRPGIYELKGDQTIDDLIRMAGGFTPVADTSAAKIERVRANARDIAGLTLDKTGLGTRVSNGDIVKIASVNPKFENEVTLRGNVANSGRFP